MTTETSKPAGTYPEHEKLAAVTAQSQAVGEFMEWIAQHERFSLGEWLRTATMREPRLVPAAVGIETILAEYFGIDTDALEREKRAMLAAIRRSVRIGS